MVGVQLKMAVFVPDETQSPRTTFVTSEGKMPVALPDSPGDGSGIPEVRTAAWIAASLRASLVTRLGVPPSSAPAKPGLSGLRRVFC
jgi:hypothetical protein